MNFLTEKIQKYHEKKLNDALQELQFHQDVKRRLEINLKTTDEQTNLKKEINKENEIIEIWIKNIEKINEQLKKYKNNNE